MRGEADGDTCMISMNTCKLNIGGLKYKLENSALTFPTPSMDCDSMIQVRSA